MAAWQPCAHGTRGRSRSGLGRRGRFRYFAGACDRWLFLNPGGFRLGQFFSAAGRCRDRRTCSLGLGELSTPALAGGGTVFTGSGGAGRGLWTSWERGGVTSAGLVSTGAGAVTGRRGGGRTWTCRTWAWWRCPSGRSSG